MEKCKLFYESFNPARITIECSCEGEYHEGKMSICIRDVELNLIDLSMNGAIPGNPRIGSKTDMQIVLIDTHPTSLGEIKKTFTNKKMAQHFKELSDIVRQKFSEKSIL